MHQRYPRMLIATVGQMRHGLRSLCVQGSLARHHASVLPIGAAEDTSLQRMVLFVSYSGEFGGAERLLVDFAGAVPTDGRLGDAVGDCLFARPLGPRLSCAVAFQHNDPVPGPWIGAIVRAAARRADLVTGLSQTAAEDLDRSGRLARSVRDVYPGVDLDGFPADVAPVQPPEVLVLGALVPWKRPDLARAACALARRSQPDASVSGESGSTTTPRP
jgi:glycosyltransferase involved in cell wall biosynthesis